jgi:hypothetical protein
MDYFDYAPKQYCFGVLAFFLIFTRKQYCFVQNTLFYLFGFFTFKHRFFNFTIFFNLVLVVFFSNSIFFSQYFFQYSPWLHLKWSLNLTTFSKSILVFFIFNYLSNFIHFFFNSSRFYLWLHFSSPFILLPLPVQSFPY